MKCRCQSGTSGSRGLASLTLAFSLAALAASACGSSAGKSPTDAGADAPAGPDAGLDAAGGREVGRPDLGREASTLGDGVPCPTTAPFDDSDPDVVARCTVPVIVGIGNGLRRATSYDGQTWAYDDWFPNTLTDQNENSHRDVAVALGLIVITGDGGVLVSADGGATFTVAVNARLHTSSVAFFRGAFWIVSSVGTYTSTDGTSWSSWTGTTQLPGGLAPNYDAAGIATDGTKLVVLDGHDTSLRIFDGTTWTQQTFSADYGQLAKLAYGGGRYVILSQACCDETMFAGLRAASTDGTAWSLVSNASPNAPNYRFGDLIWDGARFFATGSPYDSRGYTSTDGLTWASSNLKDPQGAPVALAAAGTFEGGYVGAHTTGLYWSTDAVTWTLTHTAVGDANWGFIRFASGRVLAP